MYDDSAQGLLVGRWPNGQAATGFDAKRVLRYGRGGD
jgi:hypothetical protein